MSSSEHAFAIVESVESDGLRLKFDGEDAAGEKKYKCNTFFKFFAGDRVYCVKDSGTYVAICKIGEPTTEIRADTAGEADKAKTADKAAEADSVETAKTATIAGSVRRDGSGEYYVIFREGTDYNGKALEYCVTNDTQYSWDKKWYPIGSPCDEGATYTTENGIVRFRSTGDGKLQFLLPYRNSYTWYTIATV
jgi:hypothetical protein